MADPAPQRGGRRVVALTTAVTCALGLGVVWVVGLTTGVGRARDDAMLHGFVGLARDRVYSQITDYALVMNPVPYSLLGLACIAVAFARRRNARAVAVAVVLVATGATTQALKHLLARSRYTNWLGFNQIEGLTWPSGHGTAALTIGLCAVVVAPPAWRAAVAVVGGAFAVGLAYATIALTWHYPSDLFGGFLVAGLWVSAALAVVARVEGPDAEPEPLPPLEWLIGLGVAGSLVAAALVGVGSKVVALDAGDRVTVVVGALALAALASALIVATIVAVSEPAAAGDAGAAARRRARRRVPSRA